MKALKKLQFLLLPITSVSVPLSGSVRIARMSGWKPIAQFGSLLHALGAAAFSPLVAIAKLFAIGPIR